MEENYYNDVKSEFLNKMHSIEAIYSDSFKVNKNICKNRTEADLIYSVCMSDFEAKWIHTIDDLSNKFQGINKNFGICINQSDRDHKECSLEAIRDIRNISIH